MCGCCNVPAKTEPRPDDKCPCGSGKAFKDCCGKKQ